MFSSNIYNNCYFKLRGLVLNYSATEYICSNLLFVNILFLCALYIARANPFDHLVKNLSVGGKSYRYYDLTALEDKRYGIRILESI